MSTARSLTAQSMITPDQNAVISEIDIAAPTARVFEALTNSAQLARWFNDTSCPIKFWRMDARLGGSYSYATEKGNFEVNGVSEFSCHGEIVEFDPPRLLAYTWFGNWHIDPAMKTLVRWELTPTASGTHVKVTHSGLAQDPAARKDYSGGWIGVVENLKRFAEAGKA
ncbi:MAG: SRPBCC domain-containing protein [Terriglobales bacterium]